MKEDKICRINRHVSHSAFTFLDELTSNIFAAFPLCDDLQTVIHMYAIFSKTFFEINTNFNFSNQCILEIIRIFDIVSKKFHF